MAATLETKPLVAPANESAARVVWTLAWPAVALNSLQVVNTLLDRGFIGHLPAPALTAHGAAISVMFLMFSLAMALGTSATAIVSRAYGGGNHEEVELASREALSVSLLAGIALAALTFFAAPLFASALIPSEDVQARREMIAFVQAYCLGMPGIYLIQVLAGSLRGVGDTRSPMVISGIQIGLHILLNYLLIFPSHVLGGIQIPGAGWGLVGAASALSISATLSAITYVFYASRTPLGEQWRMTWPTLEWTKRILRIAVPAALMSILRVGSLAVFTLVLKNLPGANGSVAIAAMGVGFALEGIMFMPSFGLSMASASLVGQSLGMGRPDRAARLGWTAGHHAALVTACLAIPIFFAAPWLAHLLLDGKEAIAEAATQLIRALCVTEVFFAYAMTMVGAMQGAGDTVRPMWLTIICMWGLRAPLAWLLALPLGFGAMGAWVAMSATQGVQGILSIWLFKQGKWKTQKV